MKKYYLILVFVCVVLLSFGCGTMKKKEKPATIDLSKIKIYQPYNDNVSLYFLIQSVYHLANRKLPKDSKHIKFLLQIENHPEEKLHWKDISVYNQKGEEYNTNRKTVYSAVLTKEKVKMKSGFMSIDEILNLICKRINLKYKQDGYNISIIIPKETAAKVSYDDFPLITADLDDRWTYNGIFHKIVVQADRIVVRDGGYDRRAVDNAKRLYESKDSKEIKNLLSILQFEKKQDGGECDCYGYPGIDWYKGKKILAVTALQAGAGFNWKEFPSEANLTKKSSKLIIKWLEKRGIAKECLHNVINQKKTWRNVGVKHVWFNQCLLRECTPYLSKISGIKIELTERLNKTIDLAVDLHLDTNKEYYLRGVLLMMIEFIEKEHGIKIKIKPVSDKHIVLDLDNPKGKQ